MKPLGWILGQLVEQQWQSDGNANERRKNLLHSFGTSEPVAVMEVHLLALQDEAANTILDVRK